MAMTSAWAGGSLWPSQYLPKWLTWLPEALFTFGLILPLVPIFHWYAIIPAIWSYMWLQSGHANALNHGKNANPDRENTLSPLVKWMAGKAGIELYSPNYSRLFFAVKGLLITAPIGGLGFFLWPLGYELGTRLNSHLLSELSAGAGVGVNILIFEAVF